MKPKYRTSVYEILGGQIFFKIQKRVFWGLWVTIGMAEGLNMANAMIRELESSHKQP